MKTIIAIFLLISFIFSQKNDEMKTVEYVDINQFMGKWFVISIVPNRIESGAKNASDTYKLLQDGSIDITYEAEKDGSKKMIKQKGTIVDKKSNAEWKIQMTKPYIPLMKFPFKIILLDDSYKYMVVGYPKNKMGWIMSREKKLDLNVYENILEDLKSFGYSPEQFVLIEHD